MNPTIIKQALISEKSFREASLGKFTFIVARDASKEEVGTLCKELFGVNVLSVNVMNFKGKIKKGKKGLGKRSDFKKAVVTLKKGEKIDLFDIEKEEDPKQKADKAPKAEKTVKKEAEGSKDTKVTVREKKK